MTEAEMKKALEAKGYFVATPQDVADLREHRTIARKGLLAILEFFGLTNKEGTAIRPTIIAGQEKAEDSIMTGITSLMREAATIKMLQSNPLTRSKAEAREAALKQKYGCIEPALRVANEYLSLDKPNQ